MDFNCLVLVSNLLFLFEYSILKSKDALGEGYDFWKAFNASLLSAAGLIGGVFTVNMMEVGLRRYAFQKALILIVVLYIITAFLISAVGAFYFYSNELEGALFDEAVVKRVGEFYAERVFVQNFILWLLIVLLTLITLMINDKYGPGVFADYLMGRYFMPKSEIRIFMFADIRDATTIAENLGEEAYFNFLKDFFNDIAPAVMQTKGEVYQYVGDEDVLTWKMKNGLLNANTIRCFFRMQEMVARKAHRYLQKYQAAPYFKVGIHCGQVMVGELGKIKRDIAFSGDVLNTTARIQGQCNAYNVAILASQTFADLILKLPRNIQKKEVGSQALKGKAEDVPCNLYARRSCYQIEKGEV
ncbi:MAG: adenylate cyclase [Flavobacteriales bacterium]